MRTQARAFGAFTGQRYGSFAGRSPSAPTRPTNFGGGRPYRDDAPVRRPRNEDEELMLMIASFLHVMDNQ